jgi:hypothetical protein
LTNVAEGLSAAAPRRGHGRKAVMTDTGSPRRMPDGTFDKDRACNRKRHGPENRAIIGKSALNIHKAAGPEIAIRRNHGRAGSADVVAGSTAGHCDSPRRGPCAPLTARALCVPCFGVSRC